MGQWAHLVTSVSVVDSGSAGLPLNELGRFFLDHVLAELKTQEKFLTKRKKDWDQTYLPGLVTEGTFPRTNYIGEEPTRRYTGDLLIYSGLVPKEHVGHIRRGERRRRTIIIKKRRETLTKNGTQQRTFREERLVDW